MREVNKTSKLVFDAKIARALCKQGFYIIDIKPLKDNPEKTVFVFANTDEFKAAFDILIQEAKAKKEADFEQLTLDVD